MKTGLGDDLSALPRRVQSFLLTKLRQRIFTISYMILKNR